MPKEVDYQLLQDAVSEKYHGGELAKGLEMHGKLLEQIMSLGAQALQQQPQLAQLLDDSAHQYIDVLRWQNDFQPAIALQERLATLLPDMAGMFKLGAAQLRIENNQTDEGLNQIQELVAAEPDNFWYRIGLATALLWLNRYTEAEPLLREAGAMTNPRKVDRALAYEFLFQMLSRLEGRTDDALAAWREASRLDDALKTELLPAVCRTLIYWRRYAEAGKLIQTQTNPIQKYFYSGLMHFSAGNAREANEAWRTLLTTMDLQEADAAVDEYAETCIRLLNMTTAVNVLQPLVDAGDVNYMRLVILGLAHAQKRNMERARWYLEMALRLGDAERIRLTRPAPQGRILDIHARLLYADVIINQNIRKNLNIYFIPEAA